jgi:predicted RNase H-like nuclease (RuvC/YqgF family)
MLAADGGTTLAIILAMFTLVGTLTANIVAWHKIRSDTYLASEKQKDEREVSNVEIAQTVMAQTVTTLNERLQSEGLSNERKLALVQAEYESKLAKVEERHRRDITRLDAKIERLNKSLETCRSTNEELTQRLENFEKEQDRDGTK